MQKRGKLILDVNDNVDAVCCLGLMGDVINLHVSITFFRKFVTFLRHILFKTTTGLRIKCSVELKSLWDIY